MSLLFPSPFAPEDVDILRGVLASWCVERRIDPNSTEANFAASTAIDLYQSGFNTSEKLLGALRSHKAL
ncbi:hypothetical protein [Rhizobium sp. BK251]|uniref:hypothetical protein n=1 Tax=Rhizobium sp. BK251 TaxID=2512125 RepID=UPI001047A372|nr:hypothetical protein [Rhizobium sp. BK251]TCL76144.1 hypothetical protein EV286_101692 [Rhizobium sp. BK251]